MVKVAAWVVMVVAVAMVEVVETAGRPALRR
jgi:hypothetical protein